MSDLDGNPEDCFSRDRVKIIALCLFQNVSKALINIAYGLNHSKELRDFFLDVTEKVMESQ